MPRVRQHANPLHEGFLRIRPRPVELPPGPVEVELGSAEGQFLVERAAEEPAGTYVGVEIRRAWVLWANAERARQGLGNVSTVFANLSVDLPKLFPPGRVRRFFLNFPDPWWKSRQRKRRVVTPEFAADLASLLAPGGEVWVATDVFDVALDAMAVFEVSKLVNLAGPWSFAGASPVAARSRRERVCQGEGRRIWRLGFRGR